MESASPFLSYLLAWLASLALSVLCSKATFPVMTPSTSLTHHWSFAFPHTNSTLFSFTGLIYFCSIYQLLLYCFSLPWDTSSFGLKPWFDLFTTLFLACDICMYINIYIWTHSRAMASTQQIPKNHRINKCIDIRKFLNYLMHSQRQVCQNWVPIAGGIWISQYV